MKEIKIIVPENGEKLSVNVSDLHEELLKLPVEMYLDLYYTMKRKINGATPSSIACLRSFPIKM